MLAAGLQRSSWPGVAGQHPLVPIYHVVEDRLADGDLFAGANSLPRATHLGLQPLMHRVQQHDATAVGLDPLENQLHDPAQQPVDIQGVADRQGRAIHDLQIAARPRQPGILRQFGLGVEHPAPLFLRHRADNPRLVLGRLGCGDVDRLAEVFRLAGRARVEHQRIAHLNLVAAGQTVLTDSLAVDESAVGTAEIDDGEIGVGAAEFRMMAGDLRVVDLNDIGGLASQPEDSFPQLETSALVVSTNHEQ